MKLPLLDSTGCDYHLSGTSWRSRKGKRKKYRQLKAEKVLLSPKPPCVEGSVDHGKKSQDVDEDLEKGNFIMEEEEEQHTHVRERKEEGSGLEFPAVAMNTSTPTPVPKTKSIIRCVSYTNYYKHSILTVNVYACSSSSHGLLAGAHN